MKGKLKPSKNSKLLASFANYCISHPEERFYQALVNWQGFNISKVIETKNKIEYKDMFYD